jgi:hypothetical protein
MRASGGSARFAKRASPTMNSCGTDLSEIEKMQARFPFPVYVNPIQLGVLKGTGSA